MNSIEHILGNVVDSTRDFLLHTLAPWAWENKLWLATLIPIVRAHRYREILVGLTQLMLWM